MDFGIRSGNDDHDDDDIDYDNNDDIKVAEHSFRMPFCWCNSVHTQGFQKTNMHSIEQSFYFPNT